MEREKLLISNDQLAKDQQKLMDAAKIQGINVVDRSVFGRKDKISTILLEMIYPIFYEAKDEEDVRGIVSMGVVAWNCGIIKATKGEKELFNMMNSFKRKVNPKEKKLLDEFIQLKCTKYSQYKEYITNFEISFENDGRLNFSVLTDVTDELLRKT
jgi:hypothetical protein